MESSIAFTAGVIRGDGRGKALGSPTYNLEYSKTPQELKHGVYAVLAEIDSTAYEAAMHYGPRPTFGAAESCEVHLLNDMPEGEVESITVTVVGRIRDVQKFDSPHALSQQLAEDAKTAKALLESAT